MKFHPQTCVFPHILALFSKYHLPTWQWNFMKKRKVFRIIFLFRSTLKVQYYYHQTLPPAKRANKGNNDDVEFNKIFMPANV